MSFEAVRQLESALGCSLPADYRAFLSAHASSYLKPHLLVRPLEQTLGGGTEEVVSEIYTANDILELGRQGVPEAQMLVIGSVQPGGYLYMCFRAQQAGAVFVGFPFEDPKFYLVAPTFSQFQARCRPNVEADA